MAVEPLKTGTNIPGCLRHSPLTSWLPSSPTFLIIQGLFPEMAIMSLVWSLYLIGKGNVIQKSKNSSLKLFFFSPCKPAHSTGTWLLAVEFTHLEW